MVSGCSKRVVVIRNIPSNIIEEAILILKSEPGEKEGPDTGDASKAEKKVREDHLLKEAELIINNYIKENKLHVEKDRRLGRKWGIMNLPLKKSMFLNLVLVVGIVLLIVLISRIL